MDFDLLSRLLPLLLFWLGYTLVFVRSFSVQWWTINNDPCLTTGYGGLVYKYQYTVPTSYNFLAGPPNNSPLTSTEDTLYFGCVGGGLYTVPQFSSQLNAQTSTYFPVNGSISAQGELCGSSTLNEISYGLSRVYAKIQGTSYYAGSIETGLYFACPSGKFYYLPHTSGFTYTTGAWAAANIGSGCTHAVPVNYGVEGLCGSNNVWAEYSYTGQENSPDIGDHYYRRLTWMPLNAQFTKYYFIYEAGSGNVDVFSDSYVSTDYPYFLQYGSSLSTGFPGCNVMIGADNFGTLLFLCQDAGIWSVRSMQLSSSGGQFTTCGSQGCGAQNNAISGPGVTQIVSRACLNAVDMAYDGNSVPDQLIVGCQNPQINGNPTIMVIQNPTTTTPVVGFMPVPNYNIDRVSTSKGVVVAAGHQAFGLSTHYSILAAKGFTTSPLPTNAYYQLYPSSDCSGQPDTVATLSMATVTSLGHRGNIYVTCLIDGRYQIDWYPTSSTASPATRYGVFNSGQCSASLVTLNDNWSVSVTCGSAVPTPYVTTGWYAVYPTTDCSGNAAQINTLTMSQMTSLGSYGQIFATCYYNTGLLMEVYSASDSSPRTSDGPVNYGSTTSGTCIGSGKLYNSASIVINCGGSPPVAPTQGWVQAFPSASCNSDYAEVNRNFNTGTNVVLGQNGVLGCINVVCSNTGTYTADVYSTDCASNHQSFTLASGTCIGPGKLANSYSMKITCGGTAPVFPTAAWYELFPNNGCNGPADTVASFSSLLSGSSVAGPVVLPNSRGCFLAVCQADGTYLIEQYSNSATCSTAGVPLAYVSLNSGICSNLYMTFNTWTVKVHCGASAPAPLATSGSFVRYPTTDCSGAYDVWNPLSGLPTTFGAGYAGAPVYTTCQTSSVLAEFYASADLTQNPVAVVTPSNQCVQSPTHGSIAILCGTAPASTLPTTGWYESFGAQGCPGVPDQIGQLNSLPNHVNLQGNRGCVKVTCQDTSSSFSALIQVFSNDCNEGNAPTEFHTETNRGDCVNLAFNGGSSIRFHCTETAPTPQALLDTTSNWQDATMGWGALGICPAGGLYTSVFYTYNFPQTSLDIAQDGGSNVINLDQLFFVCSTTGVFSISNYQNSIGYQYYATFAPSFYPSGNYHYSNPSSLPMQPTFFDINSFGVWTGTNFGTLFFDGGLQSNGQSAPRHLRYTTAAGTGTESQITDPSTVFNCSYAAPIRVGFFALCLNSQGTASTWYNFANGWSYGLQPINAAFDGTTKMAWDSTAVLDYFVFMSQTGSNFWVYSNTQSTNFGILQLGPVSLGLAQPFCTRLISASRRVFYALCGPSTSQMNVLAQLTVSVSGTTVTGISLTRYVATPCSSMTSMAYNNQTNTVAVACSVGSQGVGVYLLTNPQSNAPIVQFVSAATECIDISHVTISSSFNILVVSCSGMSKLLVTKSYAQVAAGPGNYFGYCGTNMCTQASHGCCLCEGVDAGVVPGCCPSQTQPGAYGCSCNKPFVGSQCQNDTTGCYTSPTVAASSALACQASTFPNGNSALFPGSGVCVSVNSSYASCQCNADTSNPLGLNFAGQWCEAPSCAVVPGNGFCTRVTNTNGLIVSTSTFCYPVYMNSAYCSTTRCKSVTQTQAPSTCTCDPAYSRDPTMISDSTVINYTVSTGLGGTTSTGILSACYTGCYESQVSPGVYSVCGPTGSPTGISNGVTYTLKTSKCSPSDPASYSTGTTLKQTSFCNCGTGYNFQNVAINDRANASFVLGTSSGDTWGQCTPWCVSPQVFTSGYTADTWCRYANCPASTSCVSTSVLAPTSCSYNSASNPCATPTTAAPTTATPTTVTPTTAALTTATPTTATPTTATPTTATPTTATPTTSSIPTTHAPTTNASSPTTTTPTTITPTTATPTTVIPTTATPTTVTPTTPNATTVAPTTPNATTASPDSSSSSSTLFTPTIIGAVAGGAVGVVVLIVVLYSVCKGGAAAAAAAASV